MSKNPKKENKFQYDIKLQSKVFPGLNHTAKVNLYCYEKLPSEKQLEKSGKKFPNIRK